ncbi:hypothetical protein BG004_001849 [Podila humilis]|nr:hypothetical protein BG004_001849 [Podila humilis]
MTATTQALTAINRRVKHHSKSLKEIREIIEIKDAVAARDKHNKTLQLPSATLLATAAMEAAKVACIAKVDAIVAECLANNRRFRDSKFDMLNDRQSCLYANIMSDNNYESMDGVKRVGEIFRNPVFYLDGVKPDDIKQGSLGDCWHLAALATVSNIPGLIEQLCVKKNEKVGVYGFIFFKDGDWISTVVDDQLCYRLNPITLKKTLYFSSCAKDRETWLPLLEKAYAKVHGDYESLSGGYSCEGTEDLTGGVATMLHTNDILDIDDFWNIDMQRVNKTTLMGCAILRADPSAERHGILPGHAYSALSTAVVNEERLVQIRNPWGAVEWNGEWSDDSEKWTPEAIEQLKHLEKDDGKFWMSYHDFLRVFDMIDICRIFDSTWSVASSWIRYNVEPRSSGKFHFELDEATEAVVVLSQPDTRYFGALKPEYIYSLSFHIYDEDDKLVKRARPAVPYINRSVSIEVNLPIGKYTVIPHVTREPTDVQVSASKDDDKKSSTDDKEGGRDGAIGPNPNITGVIVAQDAVSMTKKQYMFQQRKAMMVRYLAKARVSGKRLLGVDDEDYEEEDDEESMAEVDKWQLMVGLRVYSHDSTIHLTGESGEHPAVSGKEAEAKAEDPEDVTATLADKVEEEEWETDEDDDKTSKKKGKKGKKSKKVAKDKKSGAETSEIVKEE